MIEPAAEQQGSDQLAPSTQVSPVTSVEELDKALGRLTALDVTLRRIEATRQIEKKSADDKAALRSVAPLAEQAVLVRAIDTYCTRRRLYLTRLFGRTASLTHGAVERRWSPVALEVAAEAIQDKAKREAAMALLFAGLRRVKRWKRFVRIKYELDKEALKKHPRVISRFPGEFRRTQREDLRIRPNGVDEPIVVPGKVVEVRGTPRKG